MKNNSKYEKIFEEIKKGNIEILKKYKREVYDLDSNVTIKLQDVRNIFNKFKANEITINDLGEWVAFKIGSTAILYDESEKDTTSELVYLIDDMVDCEDEGDRLRLEKMVIERFNKYLFDS